LAAAVLVLQVLQVQQAVVAQVVILRVGLLLQIQSP
jgi:hypothetical protein